MATTAPDRRAAPVAPVALPSQPMKIRRLLCPIDLSELSVGALGQAVDLARACGASITALFVFPPIPYLAGEGAFVPVPSEPDAAARSVVAKDVAEFMRPAREAGVAVDVCLRVGDPAAQIVAAAAETNADAIVMATHGRSGFRRLLLGSVAERVLWTAPCPVITILPGEQSRTSVAAKGGPLLCALDLDASSANTLKHALLLGRMTGRPLAFLHVLADLSQHQAAALAAHIDWAAFRSEMQRHARERMGRLIRAESAAADGVEQLVSTGDAYREILRVAEERGASMIIMGVHSGTGGAVFGSTAAHVVRKAKCPVLTVRNA